MKKSITIPSDAVRSALDRRLVSEPEPSIRTEGQRDRDRILYSSALLRLGHVTQVAAPEVGHIFHSRLTHSMKVAQVAKGLAQRQKDLARRGELDAAAADLVECLDEDSTESAALAHDLGHPPFGHLAEEVLQERSKGRATFEGNPQSFRIVTRLALRSVTGPGLNLTKRTLNGILKYPWPHAEEPEKHARKWGAYGGDREALEWAREGLPAEERTLEALLMDWADDITYAVHDMDDFYRAGLIPLEQLTQSNSEERERFKDYLRERTAKLFPDDDEDPEEDDPERFARAADKLFSQDILSSIRAPHRGRMEERVNLRQLGSTLIGAYISAPELRQSEADAGRVTLEINNEIVDQVIVLKQLTWFYVIDRPSLSVIQKGQRKIVDSLYTMYSRAVEEDNLHIFPPVFAERAKDVSSVAGRERLTIDLIAGMTEQSATEIYRQSLGVNSGSLLMRAAGSG